MRFTFPTPARRRRDAAEALERSRAQRAEVEKVVAETRQATTDAWNTLMLAELRDINQGLDRIRKAVEGR